MTAEFGARFARHHDSNQVAVAKAHLDAVARLRRVGELGGHRVVEKLVYGNRKGDTGDVVRIDRKEGLIHG